MHAKDENPQPFPEVLGRHPYPWDAYNGLLPVARNKKKDPKAGRTHPN